MELILQYILTNLGLSYLALSVYLLFWDFDDDPFIDHFLKSNWPLLGYYCLFFSHKSYLAKLEKREIEELERNEIRSAASEGQVGGRPYQSAGSFFTEQMRRHAAQIDAAYMDSMVFGRGYLQVPYMPERAPQTTTTTALSPLDLYPYRWYELTTHEVGVDNEGSDYQIPVIVDDNTGSDYSKFGEWYRSTIKK